jgi:hypothetical protein
MLTDESPYIDYPDCARDPDVIDAALFGVYADLRPRSDVSKPSEPDVP